MLDAKGAAGLKAESVGEHVQVGIGIPSDSLSEHLLGNEVADVGEVGVETDGIA